MAPSGMVWSVSNSRHSGSTVLEPGAGRAWRGGGGAAASGTVKKTTQIRWTKPGQEVSGFLLQARSTNRFSLLYKRHSKHRRIVALPGKNLFAGALPHSFHLVASSKNGCNSFEARKAICQESVVRFGRTIFAKHPVDTVPCL